MADREASADSVAATAPDAGPASPTPPNVEVGRSPDLLIGALAAAAGLGVGHLVGGWLAPGASPVRAVAAAVIDRAPGAATRWAIDTFGTNDKPVLQAGVAVVTVALGAVAGRLSRDRLRAAVGIVVALAAVGLVAAVTTPAASATGSVPGRTLWPSLAAGVVAVGMLTGQRRSLDRVLASLAAGDVPGPTDRRSFLGGAAGAGGLALVGWLLGNVFGRSSAPPPLPDLEVASPAPPFPDPLDTRVPGISPYRTPVDRFYRIDTALIVPEVDVATWTLTVDGDVDQPLVLSFDDLVAMPLVERDLTLLCVSNEVGGGLVGSGRWTGVRVREVLRRAGIRDGVDQILSTSVDGMTISTPVQALLDQRDALLAIALDGEALPRDHGYPVRLVTPGLYGYVGATKWISTMTATTYEASPAYWTERGWVTNGEVKTQSRIDTPRPHASLRSGTIVIGGVAWAPRRGVRQVEVRIDDGPWQPATLGPDANVDYWRQWLFRWRAEPGDHLLSVRAIDSTGTPQTALETPPFPSGATGHHQISVTVT